MTMVIKPIKYMSAQALRRKQILNKFTTIYKEIKLATIFRLDLSL